MNLLIIIILLLIKSSFIITSNNYYVQKDGYICLSCPLVIEDDSSMVVDIWAALITRPEAPRRLETLCRRQAKDEKRKDDDSFTYTCNGNQICLYPFRSTYPRNYQCLTGSGTVDVNVTYLGKFNRVKNQKGILILDKKNNIEYLK